MEVRTCRGSCSSSRDPPSFFHTATVANGSTTSGKNFGKYKLNSIAGNVFKDVNANGIKESGDVGLAAWRTFVDTNANGIYDFGTTSRFSTDVPKAIPDLGQVSSALTVSSIPGVITDLDVRLRITHSYDADLRVYLIAPTGRRMELIRNVGGSGANFNTTLSDQAAQYITSGTSPFVGYFRPQSPTRLSVVNGISPNGTWRLEVQDTDGRDVGTITSWGLIITYAEASSLSDSAGNYYIFNIPAGTFRIDEVVQSGWFMSTPTAGYFDALFTVGSGTALTGKNFGNTPVPTATN